MRLRGPKSLKNHCNSLGRTGLALSAETVQKRKVNAKKAEPGNIARAESTALGPSGGEEQ